MPITPVNSISIPPAFVQIAGEYYRSDGDLLYAVASTGGLTTGSFRPPGRNGYATDEEWYWMLWSDLVYCIDDARDAAQFNIDHVDRNGENVDDYLDDLETLDDFAAYAAQWADRLYDEYGIGDDNA